MGRRTLDGNQIAYCDAIHVPSPVSIPVETAPDTSEAGVPVGRRHAKCCDWSLAKALARIPDQVDAAAGITVPLPPPINTLDFLAPRRPGSVTLWEFNRELNRRWDAAKQAGYPYTAFLVQPDGYAVEVRMLTTQPLGSYAHSKVVFSNVRMDERITLHYNTPVDAVAVAANERRNDGVIPLLVAVNVPDLVIGSALLVRESMLHDAPLGLTPLLLKQAFGELTPLAKLPKRRVRTKATEAAQKRRRRLNERVSSEGVAPLETEVLVVRISTDLINPFSSVICDREHIEEAFQTLLGWRGQMSDFQVAKDGDYEYIAVTPELEEQAEVTHRRTGPAEMYAFNETACRVLPLVPHGVLNGPIVVARRALAEPFAFDHLDLQSFRARVLGRAS
jgi:hypothetical protein